MGRISIRSGPEDFKGKAAKALGEDGQIGRHCEIPLRSSLHAVGSYPSRLILFCARIFNCFGRRITTVES